MKVAKAANDTAKIEQLDKWGGTQQEMTHKQLMGEAPLTNILDVLTPAFPSIADKAQVSVVASDLLFAGPSRKGGCYGLLPRLAKGRRYDA